MGVLHEQAELNHRVDDGLDIYERVTLLEEQFTALRRRVYNLEECYKRDIRMLHEYLNVKLKYTPAEQKLVKKKASK
jgi:hypothetical protein